jgi:hypothetical protein
MWALVDQIATETEEIDIIFVHGLPHRSVPTANSAANSGVEASSAGADDAYTITSWHGHETLIVPSGAPLGEHLTLTSVVLNADDNDGPDDNDGNGAGADDDDDDNGDNASASGDGGSRSTGGGGGGGGGSVGADESGNDASIGKWWKACYTFFDRNLHPRMPLSFTPLLRLKLLHACGQLDSSRASTF